MGKPLRTTQENIFQRIEVLRELISEEKLAEAQCELLIQQLTEISIFSDRLTKEIAKILPSIETA